MPDATAPKLKDVLVSCEALDASGNLHTFKPEELHMTYRHIDLPEDYIFVSAIFKGQKDSAENVVGAHG